MAGTVTLQNASEIWGTVTSNPWPGDICTCGRDLEADMALFGQWNNNNRLYENPAIARYMVDGALVVTNAGSVTPHIQ